jgi:hypothetical protein
MADLVAEMTEQGAIGLAHRGAVAFADCVLRFLRVQHDHPFIVTGKRRRRATNRSQEFEGEAMARIFHPIRQRQLQMIDRVDQPVFGRLDPAPACQVSGIAEIGHDPVEPAGIA